MGKHTNNKASHYVLTLDTRWPLPSMNWLLDVIDNALINLTFTEFDYEAQVTGPPELDITMRRR